MPCLAALAILFSALCYAVNIVLMRAQAMAARPPEITFFQNGTIAALMLLVPAVDGRRRLAERPLAGLIVAAR